METNITYQVEMIKLNMCVEAQNINHKPKGYVDIANCNIISGWLVMDA